MIINLTQHSPTAEQIMDKEWILLTDAERDVIIELITFNDIPTYEDMEERAHKLVEMCEDVGAIEAMVGGAPYFMGILVNTLKENGIKPLFSFSKRISSEFVNDDGEVVKTSKFEHIGWVEG